MNFRWTFLILLSLCFSFNSFFASPASADITSSLVGYWNFNEGSGTTAADSSGNSSTGTLTSGPTWVTGLYGSAINFDGTNDYVSVPAASSNNNLGPFTYAAWVNSRTNGGSNTGRLFSQLQYSPSVSDRYFRYSYGNVQFNITFSGGALNVLCASAATHNAWTHWAVTWDGTSEADNVKIYKNGSLVTCATRTDGVGTLVNNTANIIIGGIAGGQTFDGYMDDVRLYSRALSASDVSELYANTPSSSYATPYATPYTTPAPGDTTAPALSSLTAGSVTTSGATVTWSTDEGATSQVQYGLTSSYGSQTALVSTYGTSHSHALTSLSPNTTYHYRVVSADAAGNSVTSSDNTFTTSASPTAGVVNAASCSKADIQAALDGLAAGGTVQVPAGTCNWASSDTVLITKSVALRGAGAGVTIIDTPVLDQTVFLLGVDDIEVSGFTIIDGRVLAGFEDYWIHHMRFDTGGVLISNGVVVNGSRRLDFPKGVIDHNTFIKKRVLVTGYPAVTGSQLQGTNHWGTPLGLGTDEAVYIEDNTFDYSGASFFGNTVDCNTSGRYVFRYNTVIGSAIETHASYGTNRACRKFEIYENTIDEGAANVYRAMFIRGGTGVIFNNTITGSYGGGAIAMDNRRSFQTASSPDPGLCNGSSNWDGNWDATGYPCFDQIGVGGDNEPLFVWPAPPYLTQFIDPAYIWDNTLNGSLVTSVVIEANSSVHIKESRDIFVNRGPKPGYTPYPYPHTVISGAPAPVYSTPYATPYTTPTTETSTSTSNTSTSTNSTNTTVTGNTVPSLTGVPGGGSTVSTPLGIALVLTKTLSLGSRDPEVLKLQNHLISQGYLASGNNSGYFGPLTQAAVRKLQCEKLGICSGNEATTGYGLVGQRTRSFLASHTGATYSSSSSASTTDLRAQLEAQIRVLLIKLIELLKQRIGGQIR